MVYDLSPGDPLSEPSTPQMLCSHQWTFRKPNLTADYAFSRVIKEAIKIMEDASRDYFLKDEQVDQGVTRI